VVENYLGTQYRDYFVVYNNTQGEGEPLWINEMGYAMTPGRTEEQQANWFARAISTFF
jgi:polysaccharide biosynthesis protein PslG